MLTKYVLNFDNQDHELSSEDVRNWDEILCSYKRVDYSGVTRSFTSKFQFVNRAYELIMSAYMRDELNTKITLKFFTITDLWEWEKRFEVPLDITSLSWTDHTLSVNCIDDSLASAIKARKGTKYEFVVGEDIIVANRLQYDRLEMQNTCNHEIMGNGETTKDGSVTIISSDSLKRLPTYIIGEGETYENSPVLFTDEEDSEGSAFLEIVRSVSILDLDIEIRFLGRRNPFNCNIKNAEIQLMKFDNSNPGINNNYVNIGTVFSYSESSDKGWTGADRICLGVFPTLDALRAAHPKPAQDVYAIIGTGKKPEECESVYFTPVTLGVETEWVQGVKSYTGDGRGRDDLIVVCQERRYISRFDLSSYPAGSKFALVYKCSMDSHWSDGIGAREKHIYIFSQIKASWVSRANAISIDALRPIDIADALLDKIGDSRLNIKAHIADTDARMPKTYLLAAESVRAIPGAKLYTTFNEFCDWMQAVFGYTYHIGELIESPFYDSFKHAFYYKENDEVPSYDPTFNAGGQSLPPSLYAKGKVFLIRSSETQAYHSLWLGSDRFNDLATGKMRKNVIFINHEGFGYYLGDDDQVHMYDGDPTKATRDCQDIYFAPRQSLFDTDKVIEIRDVREVEYSTNRDFIYSTVIAGYDKQEYEAECGRDEWNFSAQYNTGVLLNDKKIELKSKYRADCYGMEFLAQQRAKDTTDNKSDSTIFFVHCLSEVNDTSDPDSGGDDESEETVSEVSLKLDRSVPIAGALTDSVFNGEYSPYRCIKANEDYLAAIHKGCVLKFASSDGNTEVVVDGVRGDVDIPLYSQLFTAGTLSFITGDIDTPIDSTALYKVSSNGITYYGYISECDIHFARAEAIKFKLIVKDIVI